MDKNCYLDLWNSFKDQRERGTITDQYLLELESNYIMMLTMNDSQRLGVRILPTEISDNITPTGFLPLDGRRRLETVKVEDALAEWQRINFPETNISMVEDYSESEMFDSLYDKRTVSICGHSYRVEDLLGYGKEAKVFKAIDAETGQEVALKKGIISLEDEINYARNIKRRLAGYEAEGWFPQYLAFDKEKNIIVMEYLKGQTLDDYISQKLATNESLEKLLLCYADVVQKVCGLKEDHNILCGQFNLKNIIRDNKRSIRFLDPLYSLPAEKYDTLQIIRIGAILMETFYGLRDNELPEKAKSAVSLKELRRISVSGSLLDKLDENSLPTKDLVEYKVKDIIRNCLIPELRLRSLGELREQFEELQNVIYACYPNLNSQKIESNKWRAYMEKRYKAVALDFNNTLSFTEETDSYILSKIAQLLEEKVNVAIMSGRRTVWINSFMREIRPFLQGKDDLPKYLHFYNSEGAIGCNVGSREIYYEKAFDPKLMEAVKKIMRRNFSQIDFQKHFRTDGYRLNFDLGTDINALNKLFEENRLPVSTITSGTSVDIVPYGVNKGVALADFASRLGITIDEIAKIADQGQKNGNDNSLLSGFGSFSVDNYEPNSEQVSTVEMLGLNKVFATAWLLDNLKFEGDLK